MSIHLMAAAFYTELPGHLKLLLLALCDDAADDGRGVCVGQARLARKTGATDRTVRSNLRELERLGWLRRLPDRHPIYHTLQLELAAERLLSPHRTWRRPERSSGPTGDPAHEPPEIQRLSTGSPLPPTPTATPTTTPNTSSSRSVEAVHTVPDADAAFDEFWQIWPEHRRQGRGAAREAFLRRCRGIGLRGKPMKHPVLAVTILEGARRFAADPNLPGPDEASFIPMPATWLNQERWDDGPLPARPEGRGARRGRVTDEALVSRIEDARRRRGTA